MAIKTQYYLKDDSKPFIFLSNIEKNKTESLANYCLNNFTNNNLRWDGLKPFEGSYWWTFPYCFRYKEYRHILQESNHPRITKIRNAYIHSLPILETVENLCPNFNIFYAEINAILPGKSILPHKDNKDGLSGIHWYLGCSRRIHVPLVTNEQSIMHCGAETLHMPVGTIYEFHNNLMHHVTNNGTVPRIHLVLDLVPSEYRNDIDHFLSTDPNIGLVHISKMTIKPGFGSLST